MHHRACHTRPCYVPDVASYTTGRVDCMGTIHAYAGLPACVLNCRAAYLEGRGAIDILLDSGEVPLIYFWIVEGHHPERVFY
ncbi:hypothetical protein SO802_031851 [Lithocarpus litseifolius]|uniref:Uncharacterized protein n=1 Tax=Lithocarpus litseifolius TaxID=425828 RepID=A0AAW2BLP0_9ROSI